VFAVEKWGRCSTTFSASGKNIQQPTLNAEHSMSAARARPRAQQYPNRHTLSICAFLCVFVTIDLRELEHF
jgi:hypothetical protein